jgi:hypothetical protein
MLGCASGAVHFGPKAGTKLAGLGFITPLGEPVGRGRGRHGGLHVVAHRGVGAE